MPSPSLTLEGVSFAWPNAAMPVLSNLSAHFFAGWHGIVGANGAGKSTLLRLVAGQLAPTAGRVTTRGAARVADRVALVPQDTGHASPSALALADAWDGDAVRLRARLGLDPASVARWRASGPGAISPGERRRWLLGGAIYAGPDVLLLDEPETHLDAASRAWLVEACAAFHGVGLIVAHDRALLDRLTGSTLVLASGGEGRLFALPASAALAQIDAEGAAAVETRALLRKQLKVRQRGVDATRADARSADAARSARTRIKGPRDRDARSMGHKVKADWAAASHGARSGRAAKALVEAERALMDAPRTARARGTVNFEALAPGPPIVLSLHRPALTVGPRVLARDVHLDIRRDDRVHIVGPNGAGKSSLLRALLSTAGATPIFHLPQELAPAAESLMRQELGALSSACRGRTLQIAATLGADVPSVLGEQPLSAGETRKLALALALSRPVAVIALDEPDNHLDLPSLTRLADALEDFPGALLLLSHDAALAARLTRRAVRLAPGAALTPR